MLRRNLDTGQCVPKFIDLCLHCLWIIIVFQAKCCSCLTYLSIICQNPRTAKTELKPAAT